MIKQTMPIFHKIIFKHIFHKRKSLYMLPKEKCICMSKRKICVASFWFLTIVILFVFVFFSFTPALKALVSAKVSIFFLKIRVKSSFSSSSFWKERMPAVELYGYISTRRLWCLEMAKSGKNPKKCSFFITKSAVEPKNE